MAKSKAKVLQLPKVHEVELTLGKWAGMYSALTQLQAMKGLPIAVSNRLARIQRKLKTELEIVNEAHQRRIREFDNYDDENGRYTVPKEREKEVRKEYEEAMDEALALKFRPVHVDDLRRLGEKEETPANYGNIVASLLDTVLVDDEEDDELEETPEGDEEA